MSQSRYQINLAVIATHPIQYHAPWFRELSEIGRITLKVYYIFLPNDQQQGKGFNHEFQWDVSLLDGYNWTILNSRIGTNPYGYVGNRIYQFAEQLRKDKINVCLITGWQSFGLLQAVFACRKQGLKILIRGDSNSIRKRSLWKRSLHRIFLRQFDAFLAVGKENKRFYIENGVDPVRIFSCPHFVDNARFVKQAEVASINRQAIRRKWGILDHKMCFIFVGKFERKKRLLDLIKAMDIARKDNDTMHLLAVGSGEQDMQARQLAISNSIPVSFAGFLNQTEISDAYVAADCLILPSDQEETWGLVVNEAMASGLPALVSDQVGCGADLIVHEKTGLVFSCGDIQDLSQKMIWMAEDRDRLKRMGSNAREHVGKYSIAHATQGLLKAVEALKL